MSIWSKDDDDNVDYNDDDNDDDNDNNDDNDDNDVGPCWWEKLWKKKNPLNCYNFFSSEKQS